MADTAQQSQLADLKAAKTTISAHIVVFIAKLQDTTATI